MNIALFIDGDNIGCDYCGKILTEAEKFGDLRVKCVLGRCDTFTGKGWKNVAHENGIQIHPLVNNLRGKSAADITLAIEVMKQLELQTSEGIVIASNDSDYTALVHEIKRRGCKAYCLLTRDSDNVYVKSSDGAIVLKKNAAGPKKTDNGQVSKKKDKQQAPKSKTKAAPQPKKGNYKQIATALKKMGCRTEKSIRNKIKSDYFKSPAEIDVILENMQKHQLVEFDVNGHAVWK